MFAEVNYVRRHIYNSNLTLSEKHVYAARLADMEKPPPVLRWPELEQNRGRQRSKRSLLPIVSELGSYLFGFATQSQVEKIKGYIKKCQENQQILYLDMQNTVAVLNDCLANIEVNRQNVERLRLAVENSLSHIEVKLAVVEAFIDLERAMYHRNRLIDHFVRAKMTLEAADLSEELFPVKYLETILKHAPVKLPISCYYQNAEVMLVFTEKEGLIFVIRLILPGPETFLEYELHTIATSLGNVTSELQLVKNVALNTISGKAFEVTNSCVGQETKVCLPTLVTDQGFACERVTKDPYW